MGFMAGFGSAFADSFNQASHERSNQEQDAIRMRFADYQTRAGERRKVDRDNAMALKRAQAIVRAAGAPEAAVGTVYQGLANGASDEWAIKLLNDNDVQVTNDGATSQTGENAPADPRDDLTQGASSAVAGQMKSSGMQTPNDGQGIFGNMKKAMNAQSQDKVPRDISQADDAIGSATGQTGEQVRSAMEPSPPVEQGSVPGVPDAQVKFTPKKSVPDRGKINNIGDAVAYDQWAKTEGSEADKIYAKNTLDAFMHEKATEANMTAQANGTGFTYARGFIKNADGKYDGSVAVPESDGRGGYTWKDTHGNVLDPTQVTPVDKNMEGDIQNVSKEMTKPLQDYNDSKNDFKTLARTSSSLSKMAQKWPEAMGASGDISQYTDAMKRAGVNVLKILNPNLDPDGNVSVDQGVFGELEKAEHTANSMLKGVTDRNSENALHATLIDIQATRLAYLWAKQMGQQGRGVSNNDFKNFKDVAKGGGNPQALKQSAAEFLGESKKALLNQEDTLKAGGAAGNYYKQKYPNVPLPFEIGTTVDQEMQADPELQQSVDTVNDNSQPQGNQIDNNTEIPPEVTAGKMKDTKGEPISPAVWQELSEPTRNYFKKKNGIK